MNNLSGMLKLSSRSINQVTSPIAAMGAARCRCTVAGPIRRIEENGTWLHRVEEVQKTFVYGHRLGLKFSTGLYYISSRRPISPELMQQALKTLQRKLPTFQVAIRERDGEPWFYKPDEVDIDFQMHEKAVPKIDLVNEAAFPFDDANGPLWRYRMASVADDDFREIPELRRKEYPYSYLLAECQHHSVFDTMVNAVKFPWIFRIINGLMKQEKITDMSPIGDFSPNEEYQKLFLECKERFLKDPERMELLRQEMLRSDKSPILFKAFPPPKVDNPTTKHLFVNMKKDALNKLIGKFKDNGITIGNGLQIITGSALIEILQDAGVAEDSYDLSTVYNACIRRYMERREHPLLGFHTRTISSLMTLQKNVRDNFWSNCKEIQKINKDLIKNKSNIEQDVLRRHFLPYVSPKDSFNSQPQVTRDFGYNSIGSLPFLGFGEDVVVSDVDNFFQIHRSNYPFYNQVFSYDGCFRNMLSYATDLMSDDTAKSLSLKIESLISYFSEK